MRHRATGSRRGPQRWRRANRRGGRAEFQYRGTLRSCPHAAHRVGSRPTRTATPTRGATAQTRGAPPYPGHRARPTRVVVVV
eukprot:4348346-Prymnesium_polylepis.1